MGKEIEVIKKIDDNTLIVRLNIFALLENNNTTYEFKVRVKVKKLENHDIFEIYKFQKYHGFICSLSCKKIGISSLSGSSINMITPQKMASCKSEFGEIRLYNHVFIKASDIEYQNWTLKNRINIIDDILD